MKLTSVFFFKNGSKRARIRAFYTFFSRGVQDIFISTGEFQQCIYGPILILRIITTGGNPYMEGLIEYNYG